MLTIKFSHKYLKLNGLYGNAARLLAVLETDFKKIGKDFREYDTVYFTEKGFQHYPLPKYGKCLVLLFCSNNRLFTTIRPAWPPIKADYYLKNIGKLFKLLT